MPEDTNNNYVTDYDITKAATRAESIASGAGLSRPSAEIAGAVAVGKLVAARTIEKCQRN